MTEGRNDAVYAMGHSDEERRRLIEQARLHADITRHVLLDSGVEQGMRVLDVGCGVGDVSLLAASIVGPEGAVVGVDTDSPALAVARDRADSAGLGQLAFLEAELRNLAFDEPFDAVVGRFVLMYLGDPTEAVRRLAAHLRPGGIAAFVELQIDFVGGQRASWPEVASYEQQCDWARQTLRQLGVETQMGFKLLPTFRDAGLPAPTMHMHVPLANDADHPGYLWWAHTLRSLLPFMEALDVAGTEEVDVETVADRLRTQVSGTDTLIGWCPVVSAWARTPG